MVETTGDSMNVYSTHLFAWPFTRKPNQYTDKEFQEAVQEKGWKKVVPETGEFDSDRKNKDYYMLYQYLSIPARHIFMNNKESLCQIYEYPMEKETEYFYELKVSEKQTYSLPIVSIELHFYRYGVGILFIQLMNKNYRRIEDIKIINDLGRRVSIPFIPDEETGFIICAESIGIRKRKDEHVESEITDFRNKIIEYIKKKITTDELTKPADFLHGLLNCRLEMNESAEESKEISVVPNADDRMFLISMIRNNELSKNIQDKTFETDEEFQKLFYSILYADSGEATCQDKGMREELLEKASYWRWSKYGSYYGVTSYSMICITSTAEDINASVVRPFLIEYSYLLSLVLAQRIAIAEFSKKAGEIAGELGKGLINKWTKKWRQSKKLISLQEDYITIKSQLLVLEVSTQEQGNELYRLMQQQLLVEDEQFRLDSQMAGLYEVANIRNGNLIGAAGLFLAALAIALDIIPAILHIFNNL